MNAPEGSRRGTVGRALAGVIVKIAEDGEILCRGPSVMRGFHGDPERTAETLDREGWLHTGDLGFLDQDGYLHLVGRKRYGLRTVHTRRFGDNVSLRNVVLADQLHCSGEHLARDLARA